jgi:hypothetical protein
VRSLRFLAVLIAAFLSGADALHAQASAYARYAVHIQAKGDSILRIVNNANARAENEGEFPSLLASAGTRMRVLAGDFDAISPPVGFERIHEQLVTPLKGLAEKFERSAALLTVNCARERAAGLRCDEARRRLQGAEAAMRLLSVAPVDARDYLEARDRAGRMLAERQVRLPPFQTPR